MIRVSVMTVPHNAVQDSNDKHNLKRAPSSVEPAKSRERNYQAYSHIMASYHGLLNVHVA